MPRPGLRHLVKACIAPAASCRRFERPVFVLAPPRSGSSFLFECLAQTEGIVHCDGETDLIWWRHFPYERAADPSDWVAAADLATAGSFCRDLYREAVIQDLRRRGWAPVRARRMLGLARIRYLDKTIANCFHLEALERLFPDACYVFLMRDPRASIASMIEGWPLLERFGKPRLAPYLGHRPARTIEHWSYPAPPGWQQVVGRPLVEICAWSWRQHVEAVLAFEARHAGEVLRARYEELVADPAGVVGGLARRLGLGWSPAAERHARRRPPSATTVSAPAPDKWQARHRQEIEGVLPLIEEPAARLGYPLGRAVA